MIENTNKFKEDIAPEDPLLDCLVQLAKYYNRPFSKEALLAGLPLVNHRLTPKLFQRAAIRANLSAKIIKKKISQISPLVLPVILLLEDNQACILSKINPDQTVDICYPEAGDNLIHKSLPDLDSIYTGFAILVQESKPIRSEREELITPNLKSWFWGTLWHYRGSFAEVMLAAFFINLFMLASPLFIMNVYDRVVPNAANVTLWVLTIGIVIIFLFDLLLRFLRAQVIDLSGKKADVVLASYIFQHIMSMQLRYKPSSVGEFINKIREFETVREFFTSATFVTLIDLPFVVLFLLLIWYIGGIIVLAPLIIMPLVLIFAWLNERPMRKYVAASVQAMGQKNAVLVEAISGMEVIKSLVAEGILQRKWEHFTALVSQANLKGRAISARVSNFTNFAQQLLTIAVIVIGVYQIEARELTLGGLIACSILAGRTIAPLGQLVGLVSRYQQAKIALQGLNKIMEIPSERPQDKKFLQIELLQGNIEFNDVSFQYPKQPNKALNSISFKIKAGERIGIIGRIGSGKSTLQKLIMALYQVDSGRISLDNIDIGQYDPVDLRHRIGYVPQETVLFSGTIRENIIMGSPHASDEALLNAANLTGVNRFINLHPAGFSMLVGDRGEGLSGGQKQAIAIARTLLTNPPILLFDEPTSSMDEASEKELINNLSNYIKNKTLILTTHKRSLLQLVDRIIVIDNGKIVFDGPKEKIIVPKKSATTFNKPGSWA